MPGSPTRPTLVPDIFAPNECQLLSAFRLSREHVASVASPTGDLVQDRLIYELARRPSLLDVVTQRIGNDIMLWGAALTLASAARATGLDLVREGSATVLVAPVGAAGAEAVVLVDGDEMTNPGAIVVRAGSALLLNATQSWRVLSTSEPALRLLTLRFAAPSALLAKRGGEERLPAIELRGYTGSSGSPIYLSPRRGQRNAFAIPHTCLEFSEVAPEEPALLADGHTDVLNQLRIWLFRGTGPETAPLAETLTVRVDGEAAGDAVFQPALSSSRLSPDGGLSLRFEWIGGPQGYAETATQMQSVDQRRFASATTYLSLLTVETRGLAAGELWAPGLLPCDTMVIVTAGAVRTGKRRLQSPALAVLPAGVPLEIANAGDGAAQITIVQMTGQVDTLHDSAVAVALPKPAAEGESVIFFCIPLRAKRFAKDWSSTCRHLDATLRSIYAQTDPNWRIIAVGNEAPDLTVRLDERFEFFATTRDSHDGSFGAAHADAAFKRATAEKRAREKGAGYIFFCDDDDLLSRQLVEFIRKTNHPFGYVLGRGLIYDAQHKLAAPLPLIHDVFSLDEQSASCAAFNVKAVGDIIKSNVNRHGHVRFREIMYLTGRPLLDVPFPAATYVRFTGENMSDMRVSLSSEPRETRDGRMQAAIASQALPLTDAVIEEFALRTLLEESQDPPSFGPKRLSVVICTHKRPAGLAQLLETLMPQIEGHPEREVVVVNDGTHDERYADAIAPFASSVRYEPMPTSLGIAGARNRSAELARGEFLVFTDDDCEVPPHWLDWVDATLRAQPELDVVAGTTKPLRPDEAGFVGQVQAHYKLLPFPHALGGLDQCFVTACLAVRASVFRRLGGFNSGASFAIAGEDTELSLRLIRSLARTRIDPDWHVFHALSTSLAGEMRRFRRYGFANVQLSKSAEAPRAYRHLSHMRPGDLSKQFGEHFRRNKAKAKEFSSNPIRRLASRLIATMIETSYDRGVIEGAGRDAASFRP